jgi:hypothetical protein
LQVPQTQLSLEYQPSQQLDHQQGNEQQEQLHDSPDLFPQEQAAHYETASTEISTRLIENQGQHILSVQDTQTEPQTQLSSVYQQGNQQLEQQHHANNPLSQQLAANYEPFSREIPRQQTENQVHYFQVIQYNQIEPQTKDQIIQQLQQKIQHLEMQIQQLQL